MGANGDDEGGFQQGAVWILFLDADGTVKSEQKICETSGGFGGSLGSHVGYGSALTALGDLDGDGHAELALGGQGVPIWILFLNANGTVKSEREMIGTPGGVLSLARLGDLDGDGNTELAVGVPYDSDSDDPRDRIRRRFGQSPYRPGAQRLGAAWILFLNADGTVRARQKIGGSRGRFGGELEDLDNFGYSVAPVGDVDGDGHPDLAVGALRDDDGGFDRGAVWLLFLNVDGTVKSEQKISGMTGGFAGSLDDTDFFGSSVASPGDIDGDGYVDLVVGAQNDDDGCCNKGAVWILFLLGDTPPALECPPVVVALDAKGDSPGEFVPFSVTSRDDRDPAPSVVCVPPSGSFFPRGTTIVTCTATDASGNRSTCTFPVVVWPSARPR